MIKLSNGDVNWWRFPGGEIGCRVETLDTSRDTVIEFYFTDSSELVGLMLLVNALRNKGVREIDLYMPYFPFARQDRVMAEGEPLAAQVVSMLIWQCGFRTIEICDPHSDVVAAMFLAGSLVIHDQAYCISQRLPRPLADAAIVAPDAGAAKKAAKLAKQWGLPLVQAYKTRDPSTGRIVGASVGEIPSGVNTLYVVDDICDGGATFIELARALPLGYELHLIVTHGIFSKGTDELLRHYETVTAVFDYRNFK